MIRNPRIELFEFISSISRVMDMMDTAVVDHHLRTAYIALRIAAEAGLPPERQRLVSLSAALHDIGAFHFKERLRLINFETEKPHEHAEAGYQLLQMFDPFRDIAEVVRFHHVPWENGGGSIFRGWPVPSESHILHLADRIAVSIASDEPVLRQVKAIEERIAQHTNSRFVPEWVEAFQRVAAAEYFWLEATSSSLERILRQTIPKQSLDMNLERLTQFAYLLCRVIDFKSEFTATHSSGVAASAVALADYAGFSRQEQDMMRVAAFLHDLGKLAIPAEILEKPDKLTDEERDVMMGHVYYTFEILSHIEGLELITAWSSMHQERLDGTGYPFHHSAEDLPLGARVLAVADVFTALTEDRPYRAGMRKDDALRILHDMAAKSSLDARIVCTLADHFDEIDALRSEAQETAEREYDEFVSVLDAV